MKSLALLGLIKYKKLAFLSLIYTNYVNAQCINTVTTKVYLPKGFEAINTNDTLTVKSYDIQISLAPTVSPITSSPITSSPITSSPITSTSSPITANPITSSPSTSPTTSSPTTSSPTTSSPTTSSPTTSSPTTSSPTTSSPTTSPITSNPVTLSPTTSPITSNPTINPVTSNPTTAPVTSAPAATCASILNLSSLDGSNGFIMNGHFVDGRAGSSVSSAGDVNGDGIDDVLIGAYWVDPSANFRAGEVYVVFGKNSGFSSTLELSSLDGSNGFTIPGKDADDKIGLPVSGGGDINGDGIGDILISSYSANPNGAASGETYVIFGKNTAFSSTFDLSTLNGANGFTINGIDGGDQSGRAISSGDVNGDGFDDIIIGAQSGDPGGRSGAGETFVVFGKNTAFGSVLELSSLDGTNGFVINGVDANDASGSAVSSAGDVNGDGIKDILIGSSVAGSFAGESYVVFGKNTTWSASVDLSTLNGNDGFIVTGINNDQSGYTVSSAGDVNLDGFDDILIGARNADPNGGNSGATYCIFGKNTGFASSFSLSSLDGTNGFVLNGISASDESSKGLSGADVNGDGFSDILIGADYGDPNSNSNAGETYVVFGKSSSYTASFELSSLDGTNGFVINGISPDDFSGATLSSAGDVNGDGIQDLIIGGQLADPNGSNSGEAYVVFGKACSPQV